MATGPIETHLHRSFNWENGAPGHLRGPRGRSASCGNGLSAQCVRLRSEINQNGTYDVLVAGGEGVKDVENDYGSILDAGMRKGRIEVSGRTPIVRELFRFDPASFYIRGMFL